MGHSSGKTHDVFLCHNSEDKPEVRQVYEALRVRGLKPWFDEVDLRTGDRWRPMIEAALTGAGTVAVFVGEAGGRVQNREIDVCVDLESRGELRIIPVILPACVDDSKIAGFLRGYSWVDTRQAGTDWLNKFCDGIRKLDSTSRPVIAVAPTSTSDARSRLIVYCQNAGLLVPRAGIYPPQSTAAVAAFTTDLEQCHLVVHLDESGVSEDSDENVKAISAALSACQHQRRMMNSKPGSIAQSEFQKEVVDRAKRIFDAIRPDPEMGTGEIESHASAPEAARKWAMVKYDRVDAKPTREMLRTLKDANIRCTSSPNGSTTLVQRLRENPFDALILVLGNCNDDWLEKRIDELIEVELTLKDQAPLQAYYYAEGANAVPPDISLSTLECDGPKELEKLVHAIRGDGR